MAPAPDGGLWVLLADWSEDWEAREAVGEPTAMRALARLDGITGAWTVYAEDLPGGYPLGVSADADDLWLSPSGVGDADIAGIARFDGRTWTYYLDGTSPVDLVEGLAVAPDGTIWYTLNGFLHQLEP